jgi:hypothetical protein
MMNPTGIVLVFAFLVLLVVLGVGLTAFGTVKLRQQVRNGFGTRAAIVTLSWRSILVAAGLAFAAYGIIGGYRLIWGV